MSSVLRLLESLGESTNVLSRQEFAAALERTDMEKVVREALFQRDATSLGRLIGARGLMCCAVLPAENEPDEEQAPEESEPTQGEPSSMVA